jgi:LacI family transcriptional regulator
MATIIDVARRAGVSTSTVSHVVNGTRPVRDETRKRVEEAIAGTGYQQDSVARALRRARTDSIGLVVSNVAEPVFGNMVRGAEQAAGAAGFTVLLANSGEDAAGEERSLAALTARRVDGLIIAPAARSAWRRLEEVRAAGIPIVLMDRSSKLRTDMVGVENQAPMRDLVLHLVEHGHRRIALAGGDLGVSTIAERHKGYYDAMAQAGIPVRDDHVLTGSGLSEQTRTDVRRLFSAGRRPTAIVATSTETAIGTLEAADDLGLSVPDDFAFATFDGFPHADLFRPRLTTVTSPAFEIGETAVQLLLRRLSDGVRRSKTVRLKPVTSYRDSCGCVDT